MDNRLRDAAPGQAGNQRAVPEQPAATPRTLAVVNLGAAVAAFLPRASLVRCMAVCRNWCDGCRDGAVWRRHYGLRWGVSEADGADATAHAQDWFAAYRQRGKLELARCAPLVVDLGHAAIKVARWTNTPEGTFAASLEPSVAQCTRARSCFTVHRRERGEPASVYDVGLQRQHDVPRRRHDQSDPYEWRSQLYRIVTKSDVDVHHLGFVLSYALHIASEPSERPARMPVLIAENPIAPSWDAATKSRVAALLFDELRVPAVAFVPSPVLTLLHAAPGAGAGLVVSLGHYQRFVAAVVGDALHAVHPLPSGAVEERTPPPPPPADALAVAVAEVAARLPDAAARDEARLHVVLTGGLASTPGLLDAVRARLPAAAGYRVLPAKDCPQDVVRGGVALGQLERFQRYCQFWPDFRAARGHFAASAQRVWQVQLRSGWTDYPTELSKQFERGVPCFTLHGQQYALDFVRMQQVNATTLTKRPVRAVGKADLADRIQLARARLLAEPRPPADSMPLYCSSPDYWKRYDAGSEPRNAPAHHYKY